MSIDLAHRPDMKTRPRASTGVVPVRVGLLGAGEQASKHLAPALLHVPNAKITAIADPVRTRRDALAARYGVQARLSTVDDLLASGLVDCLVAACPPQAHEQIAAAAIAAGVPVFLEKPPATSAATLSELADAANRNGVLTGVGMNFRWATPVQHLGRLLADPQHGDPSVITVRHVASKPTAPMWNLPLWQTFMLAQAIHPIDLLLTLAGSPVTDIQPACRHSGNRIWVGLQLHHANGTVGTVHCGNLASRFEHRSEAATSSGTTATLAGLADLTVSGPAAGSDVPRGTSRHWRPSPLDTGYDRTGFGGELAAFCTAVATASAFTPNLADLLPTFQIIEQITPSGEVR